MQLRCKQNYVGKQKKTKEKFRRKIQFSDWCCYNCHMTEENMTEEKSIQWSMESFKWRIMYKMAWENKQELFGHNEVADADENYCLMPSNQTKNASRCSVLEDIVCIMQC